MIKPLHYNLRIEPDLDTFDFEGRVDIELDAHEPVGEIVLNCLELAVWECALKDGRQWRPCSFCVHPENETLSITPPAPVTGRVTLRIAYAGRINDKMAGFYRSAYVVNGSTRHIAVTQFQESDARRALPCMDHPIHKATFDVEIAADPALTAISNEVLAETTIMADGKRLHRFERTPAMSTYLLFFGVGEFETLRDRTDKRVVGVALPGRSAQLAYGVAFGRMALRYCESYYGIPYPLKKMDLIAVPDFAFGAMENWGAITFRENLLLHDPETTSKLGAQRICEVIAHEIAHQWFGNLVTPADWKYLWLNESFATYFGFGVVDHYYPDWGTWDQFLQGQTDAAMVRDALHETIPIEIPGGEHVVINTSTAPIIYSKGGSLLRQIQGYIGADNFRKGLRRYLNTHPYACATSTDLWKAFEAVSDQAVTDMVEKWVTQPGFPLVTVHREGSRLTLSQKRFTYRSGNWDARWPIPVVMEAYSGGKTAGRRIVMLDQDLQTIRLDPGIDAYKLNSGQTGFFRVHYSNPADMEALAPLVREKILDPEDRWGLQNDLFAMVKAGAVSLNAYLTNLSHYSEETAELPLSSIDANLFSANLTLGKERNQAITRRSLNLASAILERIGLEPDTDEPQTTAMLREQVLWHAALYGSDQALKFGEEQLGILMEGGAIQPDLARSVMQIGIFQGGSRVFEWLCQRLEKTDSEHERMNILMALGSQKNPDLIRQTCAFTLEKVPDRNKFIPLVALTLNPYAIPLMWDWFKDNLDELERFHPLLYERVIAGIVPYAGMEQPDEVGSFFTAYIEKNPQFANVVGLSLEKLAINLAMRRLAENNKP